MKDKIALKQVFTIASPPTILKKSNKKSTCTCRVQVRNTNIVCNYKLDVLQITVKDVVANLKVE